LLDSEIWNKRIEELINHPTAALRDQKDLSLRIGEAFDNGDDDMDMVERHGEMPQKSILPTVACFLGRTPVYEETKAKANTYVVSAFRKQDGYTLFVIPSYTNSTLSLRRWV
jgi:hypothetical protein